MDINKLRFWSYQRQHLGKSGKSAAAVLKDILAVYSAHPSGPLSLFARVKSLKPGDFHQLELRRQALRLPAMRLSIYMLPAATATKFLSATVPPPDDVYWQKRYGYVSEEDYKAWREKIIRIATSPMAPEAIREAAGIPDEKVKSITVTKLIINRMSYEGSLLRIGTDNLRSGQLLYVAAKHWVKVKVGRVDNTEALVWLAREYLKAFGPARIKDFQWWAGVTATKAKEAVASFKTINIGEGYLLAAKDAAQYDAFKAKAINKIDILPVWDSYTMGYAPDGRARLVSPDMQAKVYGKIGAAGGNALAVVMIEGKVEGTWKARFVKDSMKIQVDMFTKVPAKTHEAIAVEFEAIAAFLGAKGIDLAKF